MSAIDDARPLAYGFIAVVLGGGIGRTVWILAGVVAVTLVLSIVRYVRFRYTLTPEGLVIEGGAFFRYRRDLPKARIQSIDLVQKLRHQMLGVVEVRVEVIGGDKTEGRLIAVAPAEAERVRTALLARPVEPVDMPEPTSPLVRMGVGDLLLAGVTGGRVAVLALLLGFFDDLLPEGVWNRLDPGLALPAAVIVIGAILVVLFLTILVSLVMTVLVYWDFTVTRREDRLIITRGLLEKRRAAVPLRRIQAFRIHENVVHRMLGLASVTVRVAGYAGGGEEVRESSMLLPVARRAAAFTLVEGLLPSPLPLAQVPLTPAPLRALRRRLVRAAVIGCVIGAAGLIRWGAVGGFAFVSIAPLAGVAWLSWRALGHALETGYVLARSGALVRTTSVVHATNVQVCERLSSPFQRRADLASLKLRIPKGHVTIVDVEAVRADARFGEIVAAMG